MKFWKVIAAALLCLGVMSMPAMAKDVARIEISYQKEVTNSMSGSSPTTSVCQITERYTFRGDKVYGETLLSRCGGYGGANEAGQGVVYPLNGSTRQIVTCEKTANSSYEICDNGVKNKSDHRTSRTVGEYTLSTSLSDTRFVASSAYKAKSSKVLTADGINLPFSPYSDATKVTVKISGGQCQLDALDEKTSFPGMKFRYRLLAQSCKITYR